MNTEVAFESDFLRSFGITAGKNEASRWLGIGVRQLEAISKDRLPKVKSKCGSARCLYLAWDVENLKAEEETALDMAEVERLTRGWFGLTYGDSMSRDKVAQVLGVSVATVSRSKDVLLQATVPGKGRRGGEYSTEQLVAYLLRCRESGIKEKEGAEQ